MTLSGGGFRATAFHIGTLRYLVRHHTVVHVCGVSGGAIAAAFIASEWQSFCSAQEEEVTRSLTKLRALMQCDLREDLTHFKSAKLAIVKSLLLGANPLSDLHASFKAILDKRLANSDQQPDRSAPTFNDLAVPISLVATDLTTPQVVAFCKEGVFSSHAGTRLGDPMPLGECVAHSAAFPALFPPKPTSLVTVGDNGKPNTTTSMNLSDGGVLDNLGLTEARRVAGDKNRDHLIVVSDASAPFTAGQVAFFDFGLESLPRVIDVISNYRARLSLKPTHEHKYVSLRRIGALISRTGVVRQEHARLASLRTDLDRFSEDEIDGLVIAGYRLCAEAFGARDGKATTAGGATAGSATAGATTAGQATSGTTSPPPASAGNNDRSSCPYVSKLEDRQLKRLKDGQCDVGNAAPLSGIAIVQSAVRLALLALLGLVGLTVGAFFFGRCMAPTVLVVHHEDAPAPRDDGPSEVEDGAAATDAVTTDDSAVSGALATIAIADHGLAGKALQKSYSAKFGHRFNIKIVSKPYESLVPEVASGASNIASLSPLVFLNLMKGMPIDSARLIQLGTKLIRNKPLYRTSFYYSSTCVEKTSGGSITDRLWTSSEATFLLGTEPLSASTQRIPRRYLSLRTDYTRLKIDTRARDAIVTAFGEDDCFVTAMSEDDAAEADSHLAGTKPRQGHLPKMLRRLLEVPIDIPGDTVVANLDWWRALSNNDRQTIYQALSDSKQFQKGKECVVSSCPWVDYPQSFVDYVSGGVAERRQDNSWVYYAPEAPVDWLSLRAYAGPVQLVDIESEGAIGSFPSYAPILVGTASLSTTSPSLAPTLISVILKQSSYSKAIVVPAK